MKNKNLLEKDYYLIIKISVQGFENLLLSERRKSRQSLTTVTITSLYYGYRISSLT